MSCSTSTFPQQGIIIFPIPPPSSIPRRRIAAPPVFPNTFPISRGYRSYVWHSYLSPLTMIKAWFSRERIPRTNIRVSYMHVYARFAYTNDPSPRCSNPNPNRYVVCRVRRNDGGGYCPGADVFLTPPGFFLSMKVMAAILNFRSANDSQV